MTEIGQALHDAIESGVIKREWRCFGDDQECAPDSDEHDQCTWHIGLYTLDQVELRRAWESVR